MPPLPSLYTIFARSGLQASVVLLCGVGSLASLWLTDVLGVSTAGSGPVWSRILAGPGGTPPPERASHLLAVSWGRGGFRERQGSGCSGEQGGAPCWEAEDKGHPWPVSPSAWWK